MGLLDDYIKRYGEPAANVSSSLLADLLANGVGILGDRSSADATRNALTYQPRSREGQETARYLQDNLANTKTMLSGMAAEPIAGWAGLLSGNADNVAKTRNALTYQPRTAGEQASARQLGGLLQDTKRVMVDENPPVRMAVDGFNSLADTAGGYAPALGAAVRTAPTALGLLAGPGSSATRNALMNVGRDSVAMGNKLATTAYENAGAVPALRGPLANQDGIFAGHLSKDAPNWLLEQAKTMQARGIPDHEIKAKTGWSAGSADGQWKYEISDHAAKLKSGSGSTANPQEFIDWADEAMQMGDGVPLHQVLDHPEAFSAYPDLKHVRVKVDPNMKAGNASFSPELNRIMLADPYAADQSQALSALLHEMQHKVQGIEGFGQGGSADMFAKQPVSAMDSSLSPLERYRRLAGEVEARSTQQRMSLTPEQRSASYPVPDVPNNQQIVYFRK